MRNKLKGNKTLFLKINKSSYASIRCPYSYGIDCVPLIV